MCEKRKRVPDQKSCNAKGITGGEISLCPEQSPYQGIMVFSQALPNTPRARMRKLFSLASFGYHPFPRLASTFLNPLKRVLTQCAIRLIRFPSLTGIAIGQSDYRGVSKTFSRGCSAASLLVRHG